MKSKSVLHRWLQSLQAAKFNWILPLIGLMGLSGIAFFWQLGYSGLVDETEPLFAEAARQMLVTGDWITPYYNETTRFDKPPLIYWLMAVTYQIVGVNSWGVRLPSAIAASALTSLSFYTLWRYVQARENFQQRFLSDPELHEQTNQRRSDQSRLFHPLPWMGAALIALSPQMIAWGRVGVSDMLLTSCLGSALLAFFLGYLESDPQGSQGYPDKNLIALKTLRRCHISSFWYLLFYWLIALAILTKGPIGLVLPGLIVGSFIVYVGSWRQVWQEMNPILGLGFITFMTLPWYILVTLANGKAFLNTFFGYHNFQRFTQVVNHHSAPWYFYFIVVLLACAPNSIYLPVALLHTKFWQRRGWSRQPRWQQLKLFALVWFLGTFSFFTISVTKLPSYIIPLIPACAILIALFWSETILQVDGASRRGSGKVPRVLSSSQKALTILLKASLILNIIFLLLLAFASFYTVNWLGNDPDMPDFSRALGQSGFVIKAGLTWLLTAGIITV
ncbi:MAG: glycosyltransferase family 39 protein [Oscillatoriales cyanobacterium RM1_1_9]|nr:glycosyltransferase family 39 protein [Oscillatoriales cyanobacterium RM1_1_9]